MTQAQELVYEDAIKPGLDAIVEEYDQDCYLMLEDMARFALSEIDVNTMSAQHDSLKRAGREVSRFVFGWLNDPQSQLTLQAAESLRLNPFSRYRDVDFIVQHALNCSLSAYNAQNANSKHTLVKRYKIDRR